MSSFGEQIRDARRRLGISQDELADGLCDRTYISLIERDKVSPSLDLAIRLADRLHIQIDGLTSQAPLGSFTLNKIRAFMERKEYRFVYELLEEYWWDAAYHGNVPLVRNMAAVLVEIIDSMPGLDTTWVNAMMLWLVDHNERRTAISLGSVVQRSLFATERWVEAGVAGRVLLTLEPAHGLAHRIAIATGSALVRVQRLADAEVYYKLALDLWKPEHGTIGKAWVYHGLTAAYGRQERWDYALETAQKADDIYRMTKSPLYWDARKNLGIVHREVGNRNDAQRILHQCYTHWKQVGDPIKRGEISQELAELE